MDIVGSASAVAQLLGQVISLWQQISAARAAVRSAPKALADVRSQLHNLLGTVRDVSRQRNLHTTSIHRQLEAIYTVTTELKAILETMRLWQSRNAFRQCLHALLTKNRDDEVLRDVLNRLNTAKIELGIRVQVAHMDMSEGMGNGIARIEEAVQKDQAGKGKAGLPPFRVEDNVVADAALQRNAISMLGDSTMTARSLDISNNAARGRGRQDNMILIGSPPPAFPT